VLRSSERRTWVQDKLDMLKPEIHPFVSISVQKVSKNKVSKTKTRR
jgi:hypothetical protein